MLLDINRRRNLFGFFAGIVDSTDGIGINAGYHQNITFKKPTKMTQYKLIEGCASQPMACEWSYSASYKQNTKTVTETCNDANEMAFMSIC